MPLSVDGPPLRLRYPNAADAPALFRLASDPEVTRHFSWGPYRREEEAAAFIASLPARRRRGEALEFAIVHEEHGVTGITGLFELAARDRRAVIGTWLGRPFWGTRVNRHSKALLLRLAFEGLGLERVTAWAGTGNDRSRAALAKLGFTHEGVLRAWHRHRGEPRDVAVLSVLRAEWERSELAAVHGQVRGRAPRAWSVV